MPNHYLDYAYAVPFHDCDPLGIVWHGNYARYFELARCALLESIGYNYDHMMQSGWAWPMIELQSRFIKPCVFKQNIIIRAEIVEWVYRLKIDFAVRDAATHSRIARGYSVQVAVDMKTQEMQINSPAILLQKLRIAA